MALAETAQLLVKLSLQDDVSATSSKVKTSLSDMGKVALGLAGAAGFGALTKGALDAEAAQGKFMAATGASRDEAKQFVSGLDSLAGSAGTVGMKFDDLAALGTTVAQQFGTTGQKTTDLTENIAEFAKVTGQDANGAAGDLEDTLSAYGLSADDAAGFMDKLVASNQKFGTDVGPAALGVMRDLAPAITAAGGNADDAVGFMNAFETSLGGADGAARGLRTAVSNLKPGQTIDDLIAQVGAIEDPFLRAQKASELFGKAAGQKMAEVIKPGMTSLDDFKVSAEEAAGKTGKAADDMLTLTDRIKGFADKATAGARELGQQFGPAITGLASLGSLVAPFASGMKDLLGKVLTQVLPSATAAGAEVGAAEAAGASGAEALGKWTSAGKIAGNAMKLGIIAGIGVVVVDVIVQQVNDAKDAVKNDPNKITPEDMFDVRAPAWAVTKTQVAAQMQNMSQAALDAFNKTWDDGIAQGLSPSDPKLLAAAKAAGEAVGTTTGTSAIQQLASHIASEHSAIDSIGKDVAETTGKGIASAMPDAVATGSSSFEQHWRSDAIPKFDAAGKQASHVLAQSLYQSRGQVEDAFKQYVEDMKHPMTTMKELAELNGELASKALQKGLASNDPLIRQQAEDMRDAITSRIDDLQSLLANEGTDAGQALADHLGNQAGAAGSAAAAIMRRIEQALHDVQVNVKVNKDQDPGHVPGGGRAEGGPVKKGVAYIVGERRPELFIPDADGTIVPRLPPLSQPAPFIPQQTQPVPLMVNVSLSTRGVDREMDHYRFVQGRTR